MYREKAKSRNSYRRIQPSEAKAEESTGLIGAAKATTKLIIAKFCSCLTKKHKKMGIQYFAPKKNFLPMQPRLKSVIACEPGIQDTCIRPG